MNFKNLSLCSQYQYEYIYFISLPIYQYGYLQNMNIATCMLSIVQMPYFSEIRQADLEKSFQIGSSQPTDYSPFQKFHLAFGSEEDLDTSSQQDFTVMFEKYATYIKYLDSSNQTEGKVCANLEVIKLLTERS